MILFYTYSFRELIKQTDEFCHVTVLYNDGLKKKWAALYLLVNLKYE